MKIEDKFYPTIAIKSNAVVREDANGYRWIIETHVEGPDEIVKTESPRFFEKPKCTQDLLLNYSGVVKKQIDELCK